MLKVIHLIPADGVGGVETAARSMAFTNYLSCDFTLMLISGEAVSSNPQRIFESPFRSVNNPFAHLRVLFCLLREKPDVLICSLWRSMFVGLFIKFLRPRTEVVCFLHLASTVHKVDRIMNNLMMRFADAIWADSEATLRARYKNFRNKPTQVISFVLDHLSTESCSNTYMPRFVFWGRLNKQKGLDRAVEFISEVVKQVHDARYEIWGPDDGEKDALLDLIKSMGLQENVFLMGVARAEQLTEIAAANSFYLQLSRMEGMAMSVVEAMQRGLVPIVTPVGEIANYCQAGVNAVVVYEPENVKEEVKKIVELLHDEKRFRNYQDAARKRWLNARLYRDDVCCAAEKLMKDNY